MYVSCCCCCCCVRSECAGCRCACVASWQTSACKEAWSGEVRVAHSGRSSLISTLHTPGTRADPDHPVATSRFVLDQNARRASSWAPSGAAASEDSPPRWREQAAYLAAQQQQQRRAGPSLPAPVPHHAAGRLRPQQLYRGTSAHACQDGARTHSQLYRGTSAHA